jgi:N-formylglutamate deformylase
MTFKAMEDYSSNLYGIKYPILHIPHSSTKIPDMTGYVKDPQGEIDLLTDHATDTLFYYPFATIVKADFSRVFCDVERFAKDSEEPMSAKGMGYFYTHCDDGSLLREDKDGIKESIYWDYYVPHHEKLIAAVKEHYGECVIFDCHSFTDVPLKRDAIRDPVRPDICIGWSIRHSRADVLEAMKYLFEQKGYKVFTNVPYSGTMFPQIDDENDANGTFGTSYMIEVNRRLYMIDGKVDQVLHDQLQNNLTEIMTTIVDISNPRNKRNY